MWPASHSRPGFAICNSTRLAAFIPLSNVMLEIEELSAVGTVVLLMLTA
jgi:hypothetical protein